MACRVDAGARRVDGGSTARRSRIASTPPVFPRGRRCFDGVSGRVQRNPLGLAAFKTLAKHRDATNSAPQLLRLLRTKRALVQNCLQRVKRFDRIHTSTGSAPPERVLAVYDDGRRRSTDTRGAATPGAALAARVGSADARSSKAVTARRLAAYAALRQLAGAAARLAHRGNATATI